jgi:hypothetical protein
MDEGFYLGAGCACNTPHGCEDGVFTTSLHFDDSDYCVCTCHATDSAEYIGRETLAMSDDDLFYRPLEACWDEVA